MFTVSINKIESKKNKYQWHLLVENTKDRQRSFFDGSAKSAEDLFPRAFEAAHEAHLKNLRALPVKESTFS